MALGVHKMYRRLVGDIRAVVSKPSILLHLLEGRGALNRAYWDAREREAYSKPEEREAREKYRRFLSQNGEKVEVGGYTLFLNPDDLVISRTLALEGVLGYEGEIQALFTSFLSPDSVVVDVGANIGLYTLLAARVAKAVYAFEPEANNLRLLTRSVEANGLNNVRIFPYCVCDRVGRVALSLADHHPGAHSIVRRISKNTVSVPSTTLDEIFPRETIDLLKVDVEGAEPLVLLGAQGLIRSHRVKRIIMEWNPEVWRGRMWLLEPFEALWPGSRKPFDFPQRQDNMLLVPR